MKKMFFLAAMLISTTSFTQTVSTKLQKAYQQFENDVQLKHAISSLYVIDAATGQVLFDKNSQVGLAPASTQKIITSVTAFELLGKSYRYKTEFLKAEDIDDEFTVIIRSYGDPTFGSFRYAATKPANLLPVLFDQLKLQRGFQLIKYVIDNTRFETRNIPDGWIMQDVGNYYGAGPGGLNWRENQFDLYLKSSDEPGSDVSIVSINGQGKVPPNFTSEVKAAAKGTGDNAYIYLPLGGNNYIVRGTIPAGENNFKISGAVNEVSYFVGDFTAYTQAKASDPTKPLRSTLMISRTNESEPVAFTYYSPSLDSIIYWFNKKSVNFYGEALVKTFAYEKQGFGRTDSGVSIMRRFWEEKGMDKEELNVCDGSGLSPLNRVTTHAQVEILKYARTKDWYPHFLDALPEYNGMKMKSGTISDVKGFCGYHKAANGKEYIFSFLVNNYSGRSSELVGKMYKVLDVLK
jgi:D-alanyl-D-alanine carboxypeptidase/D-alanyl-D-alanine-endopeptidase (penicillin-binding protein 4)